jgi:hypothetical protein
VPAAPAATTAARRQAPDLEAVQTFVSVQVFGVVAITFAAVAGAVFIGRSEIGSEGASLVTFLKWLGVPVVIAALGAWRATRAIARRIARTLTADNEEGLRV